MENSPPDQLDTPPSSPPPTSRRSGSSLEPTGSAEDPLFLPYEDDSSDSEDDDIRYLATYTPPQGALSLSSSTPVPRDITPSRDLSLCDCEDDDDDEPESQPSPPSPSSYFRPNSGPPPPSKEAIDGLARAISALPRELVTFEVSFCLDFLSKVRTCTTALGPPTEDMVAELGGALTYLPTQSFEWFEGSEWPESSELPESLEPWACVAYLRKVCVKPLPSRKQLWCPYHTPKKRARTQRESPLVTTATLSRVRRQLAAIVTAVERVGRADAVCVTIEGVEEKEGRLNEIIKELISSFHYQFVTRDMGMLLLRETRVSCDGW